MTSITDSKVETPVASNSDAAVVVDGAPARIIRNKALVLSPFSPRLPVPPVTARPPSAKSDIVIATLVLKDGTSYQGFSFGAESRSVAGECVFQTGMVGYPESLTDPSYRGQILVLTFPLVGNYGVPSYDDMEPLLNGIPKYFESREIHIAGLVIGQYSQKFSHYLANSSLSDWLKENDIPAIYGIDTRALTKKIRTQGVLLVKILFPKSVVGNAALGISESNDFLSADGSN
ncbi:3282_t:CDS:2, partial [Acaulospora colombiana]